MGSTVVKKSLEKENHRAEGEIKRFEETQKRERRKNEDLQKEPLASHINRGEWNDALLKACKIGNKEIVELMIKKGNEICKEKERREEWAKEEKRVIKIFFICDF